MEKSNIIGFWCSKCSKDFELIAKQYRKNSYVGEVWTAKCPDCEAVMTRLINNPFDPYYRVSKERQADRKRYAKYLLQPGDPNFDILYPQHKKQREEYAEKEAKKKYESERSK